MRSLLTFLLLCSIALAQDLKRPTVDSDPGPSTTYGCSGTNQPSSAMAQSYDAAGLTTSSNILVATTSTGKYKNRTFFSWQSASGTYSDLTLNVNSIGAGPLVSGTACIKYSVDNGATWSNVKCSTSGWSRQTTSISLSASQDLSKLRVSACTSVDFGYPSDPNTNGVTIYDIWTLGTTSAAGGGSGSSSGLPHRGVVTVF